MLKESSGLADPPILGDRKGNDATSTIIGHEQIFPLRIQGKMTGTGTLGKSLVELGQVACLGINGKRGYRPTLLAIRHASFMAGIEKSFGWVDGKEGRVLDSGKNPKLFKFPTLCIKLAKSNALFRSPRIRSQVYPVEIGTEQRGLKQAEQNKQIQFHNQVLV